MSHLCEHKFKHNFQDCLNPICSCGLDIESASHFLLHCPSFNDERYTLLSTLNKIDCKLLELTKSSLSQTLLYGNTLFCLFPGILEFWSLVTVTLRFTVLYNNIYRRKKKHSNPKAKMKWTPLYVFFQDVST